MKQKYTFEPDKHKKELDMLQDILWTIYKKDGLLKVILESHNKKNIADLELISKNTIELMDTFNWL